MLYSTVLLKLCAEIIHSAIKFKVVVMRTILYLFFYYWTLFVLAETKVRSQRSVCTICWLLQDAWNHIPTVNWDTMT